MSTENNPAGVRRRKVRFVTNNDDLLGTPEDNGNAYFRPIECPRAASPLGGLLMGDMMGNYSDLSALATPQEETVRAQIEATKASIIHYREHIHDVHMSLDAHLSAATPLLKALALSETLVQMAAPHHPYHTHGPLLLAYTYAHTAYALERETEGKGTVQDCRGSAGEGASPGVMVGEFKGAELLSKVHDLLVEAAVYVLTKADRDQRPADQMSRRGEYMGMLQLFCSNTATHFQGLLHNQPLNQGCSETPIELADSLAGMNLDDKEAKGEPSANLLPPPPPAPADLVYPYFFQLLAENEEHFARFKVDMSSSLVIKCNQHGPPSALIEKAAELVSATVSERISYELHVIDDHLRMLDILAQRSTGPDPEAIRAIGERFCDPSSGHQLLLRDVFQAINMVHNTQCARYGSECSCGSLLHVRIVGAGQLQQQEATRGQD